MVDPVARRRQPHRLAQELHRLARPAEGAGDEVEARHAGHRLEERRPVAPRLRAAAIVERDVLLALEAVLSDLGQNIVRAYSGREALRCLLQDEFALILLDVNMPGMDGFETAAMIREAHQMMVRVR